MSEEIKKIRGLLKSRGIEIDEGFIVQYAEHSTFYELQVDGWLIISKEVDAP